ncbi:acyl-CoA/acyl-ACP dehydrogenase [Salinirubellus salinus]|uniref:Acyl-CoA/acyl-ACP dehydrogenase n=1 Tax=Salinirubellus salinus TaxID=1364945 RepID=A0A9E7R2Z8_9EURY|nr:acyl-CoA dehydrogenase family protein [Salinirubellus salinus]UWM54831.1 acyl-CoA/acyl-ACP dehydrogenase [Salinirubellus salinus]
MFDDTAAFRAALRDYLEEEIEPVVDEADRNGPMARDELVAYLRDLRELGVGFNPETAPQYFDDLPRFAVASEEISRVWPSLNVTIQLSFPALFVQHAAESTRAAELDKLQRGECIACLAVSEPDSGSDTARPRRKAHRDGDEYVLEGSKTWVGNGGIADVALVVAEDTEIGASDTFLVSRENSPWEAEPLDKLGWKGVYNARMEFDEVRVPAENKLTNIVGNAMVDGHELTEIVPFPESVTDLFARQKPLNATFSFMRTGMAYMGIGIMEAAFAEALEYVQQRETFGKPIAQHQLVQSHLYDMNADLEASRGLARTAAEALQEGSEDVRRLTSLAKGFCCERAVDVADSALQSTVARA